jgi:3-oxoacyl-[acyl-carrier protein] reductase
MKRGHIAAVAAEASHPAPGRAVTADPAVLAARTIAGVDIGAARRAAADFLSALGIDVDREEMRETPARMTRAYAELFSTRPLRLTTFANDEGLRRAGGGPGDPAPHGLRASPAAVLRPGARRLPARRAHRRVVQAGPAGGALRGPAPGAGAADQAGRRVPGRPAPGPGGGGGARGGALVHDTARRAGPRCQDRYVFNETIQAFDGVGVVIHAAARMILAAVASYDLQAFDALQRVNARGTFVVNQQASLRLRDGGAIVNFSSSAVGLALPSYAAYAASRSASDAIAPVLARELSARDITVNAIAPALERPGAVADIANLVAFLVSEDGRWVNGQAIRANGVIGSQTQAHGSGISRVQGTARSATLTRSTSTPGGHHEHH